ncbi:MAG: hypothetical protein H6828_08180 [Planctomycetes bacterium]|nr:hypothetical protein [Planctomycetota bacterium]
MTPSGRLSSVERVRAWWLLVTVLLLAVYTPLFVAGPVGEDYPVLAEVSRSVHAELGGGTDRGADLFAERASSGGRPLAALSLGTSAWLWTSDGVWTRPALALLRAENLLLLLACAYLLGRFVRRLVVPWTGVDQAVAAGYAVWLLLCLHPLSVSAVAAPAARGDLLGGLFAAAAGTAFLRGRQERRYRFVGLAGLCTLASVAASELGFLVPVWLSLIEFYSSRRYRPGHVRLRTALTTLVVFGAVVTLDPLVRLWQGLPAMPMHLERSLDLVLDFEGFWLALLHVLEKVGVLMAPVNGGGEEGLGWLVAGLVVVTALQPALHAGRNAPRFWATVLFAWLTIVVLTILGRSAPRVVPGDFSAASTLFPAVLVMCLGLALGSTAIAGRRRYGLPLIAALLLGVLARTNAEAYRSASDLAGDLRQQVGEVMAEGGFGQQYLLVDPPDLQRGYRVLPNDVVALYDPAHGELALEGTPRLRSVSAAALVAFAREPEFDALRAEGVVLVLRRTRRESDVERERWCGQALELTGAVPSVRGWANAALDGGTAPDGVGHGHWYGADGQALPRGDSAAIASLRVVVGELDATELEEAPLLFWRARGALARGGDLRGAWVRDEASGWSAAFDPGGSLEWLLGPRVDNLLLMGPLADTAGARALAAPPPVPGVESYELRDEDWWFTPTTLAPELAADAEVEWALVLLDLAELRRLDVPCELEDDTWVVAEDVEALLPHVWSGAGRLAWALELRVDGVVLARSGGRL